MKLKLRAVSGRVISNLLLALVAALGTHLLDVIAVRDKVEQIHQEQLLNSAWRVIGKAEIDLIKERENSIVHGQWMLNKRLCSFLVTHGDGDKECTAILWEESLRENTAQHRGAH